MTAIQDALRRVQQRELTNQTATFAPEPYEHQPRLARNRLLFTPFEACLLAVALCMAQTGLTVLIWVFQG